MFVISVCQRKKEGRKKKERKEERGEGGKMGGSGIMKFCLLEVHY